MQNTGYLRCNKRSADIYSNDVSGEPRESKRDNVSLREYTVSQGAVETPL